LDKFKAAVRITQFLGRFSTEENSGESKKCDVIVIVTLFSWLIVIEEKDEKNQANIDKVVRFLSTVKTLSTCICS